MNVKEHYDNLLTRLEEWNDLLAAKGPSVLDKVMGEMHDAVGGYLDEVRELHPMLSIREKLQQIKEQLTAETGAEPTAQTIADEMGIPQRAREIEVMLKLGEDK